MNHRIKINEIVAELGLSYGSVHSIIHEHLNFNKVCARLLPRSLTDAHRNQRLCSSFDLLERYSAEGAHFLSRIITRDETWVHNFTPESKSASMIWKRSNSPTSKKFKVVPSVGKVMTTVFFDCQRVVYTECMSKGTTINALSYCSTLKNLKKVIKDYRRGKLS